MRRAAFVPPDVADLRAVLQVPAVGHLVLPADIPGVLPQQADLVVGVSSVPQRVPQMLPGAGCRLHSLVTSTTKKVKRTLAKKGRRAQWDRRSHLQLDAWLGHGPEGRGLPVGLLRLLPHHHVEGGRVLVAEDEARVVVIGHCIDVKRALEIHAAEGRVT